MAELTFEIDRVTEHLKTTRRRDPDKRAHIYTLEISSIYALQRDELKVRGIEYIECMEGKRYFSVIVNYVSTNEIVSDTIKLYSQVVHTYSYWGLQSYRANHDKRTDVYFIHCKNLRAGLP